MGNEGEGAERKGPARAWTVPGMLLAAAGGFAAGALWRAPADGRREPAPPRDRGAAVGDVSRIRAELAEERERKVIPSAERPAEPPPGQPFVAVPAAVLRWEGRHRGPQDGREMADLLGLDPARAEIFARSYGELADRLRGIEDGRIRVTEEDGTTTVLIPAFPEERKGVDEAWERTLSSLLTVEERARYDRHGMGKTLFGTAGTRQRRIVMGRDGSIREDWADPDGAMGSRGFGIE